MISGTVVALLSDRSGERVATECAKPDHDRCTGISPGRESRKRSSSTMSSRPSHAQPWAEAPQNCTRARWECFPNGCTARRRARSNWRAEKLEGFRLCSFGNCRYSTIPDADSLGPNDDWRNETKRCAPWRATSLHRGAHRQTRHRSHAVSAPASDPSVFHRSVCRRAVIEGVDCARRRVRILVHDKLHPAALGHLIAHLVHGPKLPGGVDVQQREGRGTGIKTPCGPGASMTALSPLAANTSITGFSLSRK